MTPSPSPNASPPPPGGAADIAPVTPVPRLGPAAETRLIESFTNQPPNTVLVVSDLHLGAGRDAASGRFARRENFLADDAFQRFLHTQAARAGGPALLVLNGDIFDFLRIDDFPRGPAEFKAWQAELARFGEDDPPASVDGHERRVGMHTDPARSFYKLRIMARGHPGFFAALARWVEQGNTVLYVKGNHDVEQHWPLIRHALRDEIHRAGAQPGAVASCVAFADGPVALANLHIEHGHDHEPLTRVAGPSVLPGAPHRLNLPLGSFVNRYIINRMERVEPFLDNIKPVADVLRAMVKRKPLAMFEIVWHGARLLLRALRQLRVKHALLATLILAAALTYLLPLAVLAAVALFLLSPEFRDAITNLPILNSRALRWTLSVGGVLLPFVIAAVRELWERGQRWRRRRRGAGEDRVAAGVYRRLQWAGGARWRRRYGVAGHTHHQDVQPLPPIDGAETLYVNCGTWTPLWPKDRPDLLGRTVYSFVRFTRNGAEYEHKQLAWDDVARQERPAVMLAPR